LTAVPWKDQKVNFVVMTGNIATGIREVTNWLIIVNLRTDPCEKAPHESGDVYPRVCGQHTVVRANTAKGPTIPRDHPEIPISRGPESENAGNINYIRLKAAQALKQLQELNTLVVPTD